MRRSFYKHPIHWIIVVMKKNMTKFFKTPNSLDLCRDEKEYDEVFQNTQLIGFHLVTK
jgi:hypothetical protein